MEAANDKSLPLWWRVLNLDAANFEKSVYAGDKFRLKDLGLMRKIAPKVYDAAAQEVKEHNDYVFQEGKKFNKYRLGKKIGSIPMWDVALHPELMTDKDAQEKYWQQHPELRCW